MGIQGPITAQALGRSPYDEVVQGEGNEDASHVTTQQYDHRGRPVNPETKRLNRDIVRSHNEVMLVVGVAEPENPQTTPEVESRRQHDAYESALGMRLVWATKRCVEMVGVFGVNGLRERVLVFRRYSHTPCWELYRAACSDFSVARDMLPGAPASLLSNYIERRFCSSSVVTEEKSLLRHFADYAWGYVRVHLEFFAISQRLGLNPSSVLLPSWRYLVPFTNESPISPPPCPLEWTMHSLLASSSQVLISAAPLIFWIATDLTAKRLRPLVWRKVLSCLPSPIFLGRYIGPLSSDPAPQLPAASEAQREEEGTSNEPASIEDREGPQIPSGESPEQRPAEEDERQGEPSTAQHGDYESDDEEHEEVSTTLISFDVEATEAAEAPQGSWSAELRPSAGSEPRAIDALGPMYLSTMLTRLPSLMAGKVLTDSIVRLTIAPLEGMALRLMARAVYNARGESVQEIMRPALSSGLTMTWIVNFLGTELIHLSISGEIWSLFTFLSQLLHRSEDEWIGFEGKDWAEWAGLFSFRETLF